MIMSNDYSKNTSFSSFKLESWILKNIKMLQYKSPTEIQQAAIPHILNEQGDLIGISKTGTGKTASFCLPILNKLSLDPCGIFCVILEPTRELAEQVVEKLKVFSAGFNLRVSLIMGGVEFTKQLLDLEKTPHILVATPGRLAALLSSSESSFTHLQNVRYFVLDEFDQLLNETMLEDIALISSRLPKAKAECTGSSIDDDEYIRTNLLFSATYDKEKMPFEFINKYLSAGSDNKFKIFESKTEGINFYQKTVENLNQRFLLIPHKTKDLYLIYLLQNTMADKSAIIFVQTCENCQYVFELLQIFKFKVSGVHSKISQSKRSSGLMKFRNGTSKILVATDVACRGLDIPDVDFVVNYDIPRNYVDYIHRVGRTARAGKKGDALSLVSQYDIEIVLDIEKHTNVRMKELELDEDEVLSNIGLVSKASKMIKIKLYDSGILERISERNQKNYERKKNSKNRTIENP